MGGPLITSRHEIRGARSDEGDESMRRTEERAKAKWQIMIGSWIRALVASPQRLW
jgi:hypothetical protein